ncbi:MAG: tetratricopeptide repeat protein [Myxococcales bacterium]|nr:tetratricopeptide repeat protein [Myxococcales bacterium]
MARKVKITRKQIKQDDRFLATMKEVTRKVVTSATDISFYEKNRRAILGAVIGVAVLVVAIAVYAIVAKVQTGAAEKMMAKADAILQADIVTPEQLKNDPRLASLGAYTDAKKKWTETVEAFNAISDAYPRSNYGILALLYSGNAYYELNDYENAAAKYQQYVDKAGKDAPFAPLARQNIGYCYENLNKLDEAEKVFTALSAEAGDTTAMVSLFDLARIYEKKQQWAKAVETLKKVTQSELTKNPGFLQFKQEAEGKLQLLAAQHPGTT